MCNQCKFENITHILYYDTLIDYCQECKLCSLSLSDYNNLLINILRRYNICNIKFPSDLMNLSKKQRKLMDMFFKNINLDFDNDYVYESTLKCNICAKKLYMNDGKIFICDECLRVYFYKEEFDNLINNKLKMYKRKTTHFFKRFLQK